MKNCSKLSKNCSRHVKNRENSVPYNFWTCLKLKLLDLVWFGNWSVGGGGRGEGERGGHGPPAASPFPMATPLAWSWGRSFLPVLFSKAINGIGYFFIIYFIFIVIIIIITVIRCNFHKSLTVRNFNNFFYFWSLLRLFFRVKIWIKLKTWKYSLTVGCMIRNNMKDYAKDVCMICGKQLANPCHEATLALFTYLPG